jgi:hypothetical protein
MTEQKARETLEAKWWDKWWTRGYSWAALANHSLGDELLEEKKKGLFGESSLQDYWRLDPETGNHRTDDEMWQSGELTEAPDAVLWHRAHVPLKWPDGSDGKAAWGAADKQKLAKILSLRLSKAGQKALKKNFLNKISIIGHSFRGSFYLVSIVCSEQKCRCGPCCR